MCAAGHVQPGRRRADLAASGLVERVDREPPELYGAPAARRVAWLRGVLDRTRPDLVQAHWLPTWGYFAALAGRRPLLATAWGSDIHVSTGRDRRRADWAMRHADVVAVRSRHMGREVVARGVPADRLVHLELGVDLERFRPPQPGERERLRAQLGLPAGPVVLSFRAGTALYNLDVVLDAFGLLRAHLPDATLVLAHGDAPLAEPVARRLRALADDPAVRAVGHVGHDDMPAYMRAASVGVSVPRSDGSPSSVWEALASGLPVVASDLPSIVERAGDLAAVRLVPPRPEAVAAALQERLEAHDAAAAETGRAFVAAELDERAQIARLGRVYAAMTEAPAPGPEPSPAAAGGAPASSP